VSRDNIILIVWIAVIGGAFLFMWRKGHLQRLSLYVQETKEELRKCTWPSWDELKGSTVVVLLSIALLGVFTVVTDFVLTMLVRWMVTGNPST
jgi:preprotein translocase subunit SecE